MNDKARENLLELLGRFVDPAQARAANDEIEAAERLLEASPAPLPDAQTIASIKARVAGTVVRKRKMARLFHRSVATAAAVILIAALGRLGHGPAGGPTHVRAAIIPASVWETQDFAATDSDLVYFTSQVRQIEAQIRELETDESDDRAVHEVEELEMELMRIDADFWKG